MPKISQTTRQTYATQDTQPINPDAPIHRYPKTEIYFFSCILLNITIEPNKIDPRRSTAPTYEIHKSKKKQEKPLYIPAAA